MPKSTLTSKYQTTVPRRVREHLGVAPHDVLSWEVREGAVVVTVADTAFLGRRGTIHVGQGGIEEDLRLARSRRGTGRA